MQHQSPSVPEYLDGQSDFYVEPGSSYMNDPNIIGSVNGVPTVEALLRKIHQEQDESWM